MKNKIIIFIAILLFAGSCRTAAAQSNRLQAMEEELVFIQHTAQQIWQKKINPNYDYDDYFSQNIEIFNLLCEQFSNMLNYMLEEDRNMTYPFTKLLQQSDDWETLQMDAVWSADSLLRVFSWTLPGGTMHFFGNALQGKNPDSNVSFSFPLPNGENSGYYNEQGYYYDTVYVLKESHKTIYVLSGATQASTLIPIYGLTAISIQDNGLVAEKIFEDKNGDPTYEIGVNYDLGCSDLDGGNFPRPSINEQEKTMNFLEVKNGCFTGKYIKYKFDGKKFKIMAN